MTIQSIQSGFAEVNGASIYYELAGQGQPVVLIHGANLDCRMWEGQFAEFAKHYRVLRFDLRGLGRTKAAESEFTNYEDIRALLDHFAMDQVYLVGHSFGGYTALEFALVYPERVKGLVLTSANVGGTPPSEEMLTFRTQFQNLMTQHDTEEFLDLSLQAWVDGPGQSSERVPAAIRNHIRQMTVDSFALPKGKMPTWLKPSPGERLSELQMPILTLVGDHDFPDYHHAADTIVTHATNVSKVVIADAAHSICMERAAEWNREILAFFSQTTRNQW